MSSRAIDELNEIADKIEMYLEGSRNDPDFVELDSSDHDNILETLHYAEMDLAMENDHDFNKAYWRARHWFERWNDEEYPNLEDIMDDMFPEGVDDGFDFCGDD